MIPNVGLDFQLEKFLTKLDECDKQVTKLT
jgi:hypothetical protein